MPELLPEERLQPSLLDRLTDDDPSNVNDPRDERVLTLPQLQRCVLRDLGWLFNTAPYFPKTAQFDLENYPGVADSVLNYGMRNLAGFSSSEVIGTELAKYVRDLIIRFEPRILQKTLEVEILTDDEAAPNSVNLLIRGQLWAQPVPIELYLKSELDLESGTANLIQNFD